MHELPLRLLSSLQVIWPLWFRLNWNDCGRRLGKSGVFSLIDPSLRQLVNRQFSLLWPLCRTKSAFLIYFFMSHLLTKSHLHDFSSSTKNVSVYFNGTVYCILVSMHTDEYMSWISHKFLVNLMWSGDFMILSLILHFYFSMLFHKHRMRTDFGPYNPWTEIFLKCINSCVHDRLCCGVNKRSSELLLGLPSSIILNTNSFKLQVEKEYKPMRLN